MERPQKKMRNTLAYYETNEREEKDYSEVAITHTHTHTERERERERENSNKKSEVRMVQYDKWSSSRISIGPGNVLGLILEELHLSHCTILTSDFLLLFSSLLLKKSSIHFSSVCMCPTWYPQRGTSWSPQHNKTVDVEGRDQHQGASHVPNSESLQI